MAELKQNRRLFTRINFDANCILRSSENQWSVTLIDICLKGALAECQSDIPLNIGDEIELDIMLDGEDVVIKMPARIHHQQGTRLGVQAMGMDLASISHLRRLVELNLGDPALLERELIHLYSA